MSTIDAVLFDFGGTLFAHDPLAATVVAAAAELGVAVPIVWAEAFAERVQSAAHTPDELRYLRDLDAALWHSRWHVLYALADDELCGLGAAVYTAMHDPYRWLPYADTVAVLRGMHDVGVPAVVVSNTGWDIRAVFAAHGLEHLVTAFVLSYEVGFVKPASEIFLHACRLLDVQPTSALMVGDDPVADAGAVRAGVRTLLLPALPPGTDNGVQSVLNIVRRI